MYNPDYDRSPAIRAKPAVPGLAYYTPDLAAPKRAPEQSPPNSVAFLTQMYSYYAD